MAPCSRSSCRRRFVPERKSMARTILVIDDERSIQQTLTGVLEDEGYKVRTASSGEEGVERARTDSPDVILLDIWMPGMDGLEALKKIRAENPRQLVIMMSGH